MHISIITSIAMLFVTASASASAGMTSTKLEPGHSALLFARQSDDCVSQYGQGWQACNGSGLCYNAAAGAVCCTDDTESRFMTRLPSSELQM
jgi:hypothetical protein